MFACKYRKNVFLFTRQSRYNKNSSTSGSRDTAHHPLYRSPWVVQARVWSDEASLRWRPNKSGRKVATCCWITQRRGARTVMVEPSNNISMCSTGTEWSSHVRINRSKRETWGKQRKTRVIWLLLTLAKLRHVLLCRVCLPFPHCFVNRDEIYRRE